MKQRIIYFIAILMFSSCSDFLEPKSKSEFVPKDVSSMNELLLGTAYPRWDTKGFNVFLNILDDDVTCAPYQPTTSGQNRKVWQAAYTWQPDMFTIFEDEGLSPDATNIYQTYYTKILGANAVLDYIDDLSDESDMRNLVTAQSHALRGYYYFTLVNIFGVPYNENKDGLGVPLKLTSGIEDRTFTRNTVQEVYEQVLKDLLEAERLYKLIPESEHWKNDYKTSLPMVQLLLSRVYLYMEEWQKSADYAQLVIANPNFSLFDLNNIITENDEGERVYTNFHSFSSPEVIWLYGNTEDVTYFVRHYSGEDANDPTSHCYFRASDELLESFKETAGDLRAERYIIGEYNPTYVNGEAYYIPQAFGKISVSSDYRPGSNIFARSFRLSEAYLNLSEAAAMLYKEKGDNNALTQSLQALNTLRKYRFEDYTDEHISDSDKLISFIQRERRRELCFEDHRWFDLRRWGMKSIQHTWIGDPNSSKSYTLEEKDRSYTLPLPKAALEQNKSLVQNPLAPAPRTN
ncbi:MULTISPECIES: RagB/SusD family nutrient uptake outer membrane protein [unclassified Butyricimonas]|uniref:RagB/SusD family nutrient uptake outer membrane protein n=1 Tax=unclassified Butyricimonas TaxID=2637652 RepID=UPI000C088031|nr:MULTISPECIES: RagB/SusD family nutrient uptake outer membrane protein [unclassified Butyricimonas]